MIAFRFKLQKNGRVHCSSMNTPVKTYPRDLNYSYQEQVEREIGKEYTKNKYELSYGFLTNDIIVATIVKSIKEKENGN